MARLAWLATVLVCLPLVSACSSGNKATPTAKPVAATKVYRDPRFHFSFHYPSNWKAPKQGSMENLNGTPTYIVRLSTPDSAAGVEYRVDASLPDYSKIPDGKVVVDPQNPQQRFRYHKLQISGWPSISIERFIVGKPIDEYVTVTNTRKLSYAVEMLTPNPPFPAQAVAGYRKILSTAKIPFSG